MRKAYRLLHLKDFMDGDDTTMLVELLEYPDGQKSLNLEQIEGNHDEIGSIKSLEGKELRNFVSLDPVDAVKLARSILDVVREAKP